jgi:hypothetical protein
VPTDRPNTNVGGEGDPRVRLSLSALLLGGGKRWLLVKYRDRCADPSWYIERSALDGLVSPAACCRRSEGPSSKKVRLR